MTQICISYIDPALPYETRREVLNQSYGFTCECDRCRTEAELLPLPAAPSQLAPAELLLRDFVFPDLSKSGRILMPFSSSLPLRQDNVDQFPRNILSLLDQKYLPALSEAFSSASHGGRHNEGVTKGATLLALYFVLYPGNYPLVGKWMSFLWHELILS